MPSVLPADLAGQRFSYLVVLRETEKGPGRNRRWVCQCDCGNEVRAYQSNLRLGKVISCGCVRRDPHLKYSDWGKTAEIPEHSIWCGMRRRCEDPNALSYVHYGGRGISVCPEWQSFEAFYRDMGPRPTPEHSIDRIDVNGDYEPGNCRWATSAEQMLNTRANHILTFNGKSQPVTAWAREVGIPKGALFKRLKMGWTVEQALTTPKLNVWSRRRR